MTGPESARYYCAKCGNPATVDPSSIGLDPRFGQGECPTCSAPPKTGPERPVKAVLVVRADYTAAAEEQVRQRALERAVKRAGRRPARPF